MAFEKLRACDPRVEMSPQTAQCLIVEAGSRPFQQAQEAQPSRVTAACHSTEDSSLHVL